MHRILRQKAEALIATTQAELDAAIKRIAEQALTEDNKRHKRDQVNGFAEIDKLNVRLRNLYIYRDYQTFITPLRLARMYSLTGSTVRQIVRSIDTEIKTTL